MASKAEAGFITQSKIRTAVEVAEIVMAIPRGSVLAKAKGTQAVVRGRALAAYLASIQGGVGDPDIATVMGRDRSSVTHMLKVVENLREHECIDQWLERLTGSLLSYEAPDEATRDLFVNAVPDEALAPAPRNPVVILPTLTGAEKVIAEISDRYGLLRSCVFARSTPVAIRHEAMAALYQLTTPAGRRIFTTRRIAQIAGVTHSAVVRALVSANRAKTGEI